MSEQNTISGFIIQPKSIHPNFKDLSEQTFDKLFVVGYLGRKRWLCRCECGVLKSVGGCELKRKSTRSCGCSKSQMISDKKTVHGNARHTPGGRTTEYHIWLGILKRCLTKTAECFKNHGGRGIKVCDRWKYSFEAFLEDVGRRPSPLHTLDRFPDNNGDYEPGNVRWATWSEQMRNTRANRLITLNGVTKTLVEWSERTGIPANTIRQRLVRGWSVSASLIRPVRSSGR